jgi:alcohol dehydrogenase class IV
MEITFYVPTKIFLGKGCIIKNAKLFAGIGKKALIVTYPVSKNNGSLSDVESALKSQGVDYEIFIDAPLNPELKEMEKLGEMASKTGADMMIGIGGGSALDTAKTLSVLAVNRIPVEDLYKNVFAIKPLPVITVPTTCGSGSEVTPFSVLVVKSKNIKRSFGHENIMSPVYAFLDASYIETLPEQIAADSAVDALSHGIEGFIRSGGTWVSDMLGLTIFKHFANCRHSLQTGKYTFEIYEELLFNATLSGLMINQARTLAVHAMGYALTINRGLSHGCACGILLGAFLEYIYPACSNKADEMYEAIGVKNTKEFNRMIDSILKYREPYAIEELERYTDESFEAAAAKPNPKPVDRAAVLDIFKKALIR